MRMPVLAALIAQPAQALGCARGCDVEQTPTKLQDHLARDA
jgi:hypothetical protein